MTGNPRWRFLTEGWMLWPPLLAAAALLAGRAPRLAFVPLTLAGVLAFTFRDPDRNTDADPDVLLAPADGRILRVASVWDDFFEQEMIEIAIFLALWDVHVQRSPSSGQIIAQRQKAGGYRPAMTEAATYGNNQVLTYLRTDYGPCAIAQISGLVARRIVTWVEPGDHLCRGDRIGMIKLSSQVTVRVPISSRVTVDAGERVQAGITPLARMALPEKL